MPSFVHIWHTVQWLTLRHIHGEGPGLRRCLVCVVKTANRHLYGAQGLCHKPGSNGCRCARISRRVGGFSVFMFRVRLFFWGCLPLKMTAQTPATPPSAPEISQPHSDCSCFACSAGQPVHCPGAGPHPQRPVREIRQACGGKCL